MPTDQELIRIVPSDRQLAYQETEFYAFFHFGMNTYTDREWGDGTEDPKLFNPAKLDADQWVSAAKSASTTTASAFGPPDTPVTALPQAHGKREPVM